MSIERAVELIGSQAETARRIGVSPQAITKWLKRGRPPAERCMAIEAATNGEVTRSQLRPDVFGKPADQQEAA